MKFTKMHGAGNDFIIINLFEERLVDINYSLLARRICHRRTGIGADGLMLVTKAEQGGDFKLLFYNPDGLKGEMCGNGARCIARYGYEHGLAGETQRIETTAGLITGERIDDSRYRIRLNDPSIMEKRFAENRECGYVELGNPGLPHAVTEWPELSLTELKNLGSALRYSDAFPKGANVSFYRITGADEIEAITYERGVEDFTLACGTGSGSIVSVLTAAGLVSGKNVKVKMPGGELLVSLSFDGAAVHDIYLTGPTCIVCSGKYEDF